MNSESNTFKRQHPDNQYLTIYDRILKQKKRFQNQFQDQQPLQGIPAQSNRSSTQYIYGVVENFARCILSQKEQYGLQNEGKCFQFTLNRKYLIVITTQLPSFYPKDTPVALYLPISMTIEPQKIIGDKQLVVIRRFQESQDPNLMLYPYIIVEPDQYLHPTYICSWLQCKRYISLQHYLKSKFEISLKLVFGDACHKFLEYLLDNATTIKNKSFDQFQSVLKNIYQSLIYQFYVIMNQEQVKVEYDYFLKECRTSLENIHKWVIDHVVEQKVIKDVNYPHIEVQIKEVIGSQTTHTSNYFGLKGKTDGLLKGIRHDKLKKTKDVVFIPFQLKTGAKVYDSHKKQLDIYNLLIRQKENTPTIGLLYYSEKDFIFFRLQKAQLAFSNIVVNRNTILVDLNRLYQKEKLRLPNFTFAGNPCRVCDKAKTCQTLYIVEKLQQPGTNYYKNKYLPKKQEPQSNNTQEQQMDEQRKKMLQMFEQMDQEEANQKQKTPSDQNNKVKDLIESLRYPQIQYIRKWMLCLHSEERQTRISKFKKQKEGWNKFVLQSPQLVKIKQFYAENAQKQNDFRLKLRIQKKIHSLQEFQSLKNGFKASQKIKVSIAYLGISQSGKITASTRQAHNFCLDIQFVSKQITYSKGYLERGIREDVTCNVQIESYDIQQYTTLRNTVFDFVTGKNQTLKKLVIPQYQLRSVSEEQSIKQLSVSKVKIEPEDYQGFNIYQKQAFQKTFSNEYCTLVEGMPGTGKTELIVKILEKSQKQGLKVLVTTFTNRSLDNIIGRAFKSGKIQENLIIRQGSKESIEPKFLKFNSSIQSFSDIYQYRNYFDSKKLWFVTLASISSPHIPKDFDLVILDEASQSLQPACISALLRGKKIVLIGDYNQLQPIVKSKKAISQGMNISLFQKLCLQKGASVIPLFYQYRMNQQIMKLSNSLVYNNCLKLDPDYKGVTQIELDQNWLSICEIPDVIDIVNPKNPLVFLNHDRFLLSIGKRLSNQKEQILHLLEIDLAIFFFEKLLKLGIGLQDIAIVCVYNRTVDEIKNYLQKSQLIQQKSKKLSDDKEQSQVLTIDKSQGIDKKAIILLAESRQTTNNTLMQDRKRLNVALTRAKNKLIIIGSINYLQQENSVFDGRLPNLLRGKCEFSIENQLVNYVLNSFEKKQGFNKQK